MEYIGGQHKIPYLLLNVENLLQTEMKGIFLWKLKKFLSKYAQ